MKCWETLGRYCKIFRDPWEDTKVFVKESNLPQGKYEHIKDITRIIQFRQHNGRRFRTQISSYLKRGIKKQSLKKREKKLTVWKNIAPIFSLFISQCLGGEGLFARKDLFQGEIVALYNGIKVKQQTLIIGK